MNIQPEVINLLLIEDNPGDARLLEEMLADEKTAVINLRWAQYLSESLELIKEARINIVLLDLELPDSSGLNTLINIQQVAPGVPIIVLTGLNDENIAIEAMRKGAQDYIVKGQLDGNLLMRAMRYAIERNRLEKEREKLITELKEALAKIKTLTGLIPICSFCKKIRDDKGYWNQIEEYVKAHSLANFSHSICPQCAKKYYPNLYKEKKPE
ncbi:MAG: response regulator [Spirochaetales bacterium]|nr:response regulator [Spirochaetales bacterium]